MKELVELLATGFPVSDGLIFDPRAVEQARWPDLVQACKEHGIPLILDSVALEVRAVGTSETFAAKAPWAGQVLDGQHRLLALAIADFCAEYPEFSAVMAPAAIVSAGSDATAIHVVDPSVADLREALDAVGRSAVQIHYPLVGTINDLEALTPSLLRGLSSAPVDAIWLRIHRAGRNASRDMIKRVIRWCRELQSLGVPLVGDYTGQLGLGLYGFGALDAFTSGMTFGDNPDVRKMIRSPRKGSTQRGFTPPPRVYVPELDLFFKPQEASKFFDIRPNKARFACRRSCCQAGFSDMLAEPRRHFLVSRNEQVRRVVRTPAHLQSEIWLDRWLRPASDLSFSLAGRDEAYAKHAKRLRYWREAFVSQREADLAHAAPPVRVPLVISRRSPHRADISRSS